MVPGAFRGAIMLPWVTGHSGSWMGGGGEIHIGAEGLREDRYCTGGCDR